MWVVWFCAARINPFRQESSSPMIVKPVPSLDILLGYLANGLPDRLLADLLTQIRDDEGKLYTAIDQDKHGGKIADWEDFETLKYIITAIKTMISFETHPKSFKVMNERPSTPNPYEHITTTIPQKVLEQLHDVHSAFADAGHGWRVLVKVSVREHAYKNNFLKLAGWISKGEDFQNLLNEYAAFLGIDTPLMESPDPKRGGVELMMIVDDRVMSELYEVTVYAMRKGVDVSLIGDSLEVSDLTGDKPQSYYETVVKDVSHRLWVAKDSFYFANQGEKDPLPEWINQFNEVEVDELYLITLRYICHDGVYPESFLELELKDESAYEILDGREFIKVLGTLGGSLDIVENPNNHDSLYKKTTFVGVFRCSVSRDETHWLDDIEFLGAIRPHMIAHILG
jgi:hypothetical protein